LAIAGTLHWPHLSISNRRLRADAHVLQASHQRAEGIGLGEPRDDIAELEVGEDVLHVRRKAVEVGLEVVLELLLGGAGLEVARRKGEVL
jgi:hypothetical protein